MLRVWRLAAVGVCLLAAFIFLNNTNLLAPGSPGTPILLAHRGIAQRFETTGITGNTCTASRMLPSTHGYRENTIASMRASFEAGADIVKLDAHPTTDGQFAVFHDWTLDCRTEGHGVGFEVHFPTEEAGSNTAPATTDSRETAESDPKGSPFAFSSPFRSGRVLRFSARAVR